jgi:hypothetical protein
MASVCNTRPPYETGVVWTSGKQPSEGWEEAGKVFVSASILDGLICWKKPLEINYLEWDELEWEMNQRMIEQILENWHDQNYDDYLRDLQSHEQG